MEKFEKNTRFTFKKSERLTSKKTIQALFSEGRNFYLPPIKVYYLPQPDSLIKVHQVLFSVPKRLFKRAVDRNRIKRIFREAYRLNKSSISDLPINYCIGYIYTMDKMPAYKLLSEKLIKSLQRLKKEIN